jgi:hypothetical protein
MSKTYKIRQRVDVEKTVNFCEECDFHTGGYSGNHGWHGNICMLHQRQLDGGKEHVPIPDWCKIDECKYALSRD